MCSPSDYFLKELRFTWANLPVRPPERLYMNGQELRRLAQMSKSRVKCEQTPSSNLLTRLHSTCSGVSADTRREGVMAQWFLHQDESYRPKWARKDDFLCDFEELIWNIADDESSQFISEDDRTDGENIHDNVEHASCCARHRGLTVAPSTHYQLRHAYKHRKRLPAKLRRRLREWISAFNRDLEKL
jgi:hypothetical protein